MATTLSDRILSLLSQGQNLNSIALATGASANLIRQVAQSYTSSAYSVTNLQQRAFDLLSAGHPAEDVAALTGLGANVVAQIGASLTLTQTSGFGPGSGGGGGSGQQALSPTSVQSSSYSATANQLVPVDASGGAITVTLPAAPADQSRVAVKIVAQATTPNTVTLARAGSDVFNKAGGSTSLTYTALNTAVTVQYQASTGIWFVLSTDAPLGQKGGAAQLDTTAGTLAAAQVPASVVSLSLLASGSDDTAAFNALLATLPTVTVSTGGGSPSTYLCPKGTIRVKGTYTIGSRTTTTTTTTSDVVSSCPSTFALGSTSGFIASGAAGQGLFSVVSAAGSAIISYTGVSGNNLTGCAYVSGGGGAVISGATVTLDTNNIGPFVSVIGDGHNTTQANYYGAGDCLRMFNPARPVSDTWDLLSARMGRIDALTIDGTNAQAGAAGLHYGDTEGGSLGSDLYIQNFTAGQISAPAAPTVTPVGSGGGNAFASGGTFFWGITWLTRTGETLLSSTASATIAANGSATVTIPAAPAGAIGGRVYRGTSSSVTGWVGSFAAGATTYTDIGAVGTTGGKSYPPVNASGNNGLWLDNTVSWTENNYGRVVLINNANNVMFSAGSAPIGDASFEYNDFTFKVYAKPGQNGVLLSNGAWMQHGELKVRGNFASSSSAQNNCALGLYGTLPVGRGSGAGSFAKIQNQRLDVQVEENTLFSGGGANYPMTIAFGDNNSNAIYGCIGILSFSYNWVTSNWSGSNRNSFQFVGTVTGDTALNPANDTHPTRIGGNILATGKIFNTGTIDANTGELFAVTLTQNVTWSFNSSNQSGGPQRITIIVTQAASGGPFTVTWPKPGSPALSTPAVYWPGGTAPTMSATASAVDKYVLETVDGIRWYGTAAQALS